MSVFRDLTGQIFGRLTAAWPCGREKGHTMWFCFCECGRSRSVEMSHLVRGHTHSCGCIHAERILSKDHAVHGLCYTPEYRIFNDAKNRCTNPRNKAWKNYGGRGIAFRFGSPKELFDEIGPRPSPKHTLDRRNNDGHYEPGNVRWATRKEQANNRRLPRKRAA